MRWAISGAPVPATLPYAAAFNVVCTAHNFPPLFAYAVGCRESIVGEMGGKWDAATVVSGDGGHGIMQLTSSWPNPGWDDPVTNVAWGIEHYLQPAVDYWAPQGFTGDDLIRLVAATFNAGLGNAIAGHDQGSVDLYTTDNYAAGVLTLYKNLVAHGKP